MSKVPNKATAVGMNTGLKGLRARLDIENKILIPFMVLIALSIGVLGLVSYWNGYRLLLDNQRQRQIETVSELLYHLESVDLSSERVRQEALRYLSGYRRPGLVLLSEETLLVNQLSGLARNLTRTQIQVWLEVAGDNGFYEDRDWMMAFRRVPGTDWTLAVAREKRLLASELADAQKYSILVAIISLILSMQATILIAHHLSRPIRLLAEQCNQMSAGDLETQLEMDRGDEIGILADAFNQMIRRLQENARKLIEANQFSEDILRSLTTGVLVTDQEGRVLNQNEAARRLLGPGLREQDSGKPFVDLIREQLSHLHQIRKPLDQLFVLQSETVEEKRYFATSAAPLTRENGSMTGAIFSFNDITERKRLELRMERVNRMAYVGQLASGLAHEIRNPLAGMKTSVQVLRRRLVQSEADRNGPLFDNVVHEIDRLNQLVSELLDFAKPHRPDLRRVDLAAVIERSVALLAPGGEGQGVRLSFVKPLLPVTVMADENQVEQILLNVMTNALRASVSGNEISIRLLAAQAPGDFVRVTVADQGCGIAPADLEKVFDPFFTTHASGTGLGLSVVQKLMTDHGGEIQLSSREGAGTTVTLSFPDWNSEEVEA